MNDGFLRMFGYRKGELEGSNVSRIMPAPFSMQHDGGQAGRVSPKWPRQACLRRDAYLLLPGSTSSSSGVAAHSFLPQPRLPAQLCQHAVAAHP